MAFTALYDGDERGAWSVPRSERATCPECGDEMHVVSESTDGRARHFSHNPDRTGGGGGGGGCSGGESDDHKKWKNFAAERLDEVFGDRAAARASVEQPLAAPWSDKDGRAADACVFFENWDNQFGRGLAIEVQHKHKDKDKHAVEMDYNRQGVAVLWLSGEYFHENGLRMREVDIRHRTRDQTSISELADKWVRVATGSDTYLTHTEHPVTHKHLIHEVEDPRDKNAKVPAKIPDEVFDQAARELWRKQEWRDLFTDPHSYDTDTVNMPPYPRGVVEIEVPILDVMPERYLYEDWKRGRQQNEAFDVYVCSICDEQVCKPNHPESNFKHFKYHLKSEHKQRLQRLNNERRPYRQLVEEVL